VELRFDYIDSSDIKDELATHTKVMQLANNTTLYDAIETMVGWCIKRDYCVRGWTIRGKYKE
jgi:hypothetical protein